MFKTFFPAVLQAHSSMSACNQVQEPVTGVGAISDVPVHTFPTFRERHVSVNDYVPRSRFALQWRSRQLAGYHFVGLVS